MKKGILAFAATLIFAALPVAAFQAQQAQQQQGPKPKSQKEVDALKKVQETAQAGDWAGEIAAINNVLENFADTEYKSMLLGMAMDAAQRKGDVAESVVWGERVIQNDPNDYTARITLAESIAQHVRENDLDKDQNLKKVDDYANKGLELVKAANTPPAGIPPDKWPEFKKQMTSEAYDALGLAATARKNYADAIKNFQTGIEADAANSVPQAHLSKAYLDNKQYDEAIAAADKVIGNAQAPASVKTYAQTMKDAATKLKGSAAPAPAPAPAPPK
jgi:tetratricopeptide (TPR) repeat protein